MSRRNDGNVVHNNSFFQRNYDPTFARSNAISSFLMLPGLRGYWPMSTVQSTADVRDYSGNGLTLTRVGALYGFYSLAPMVIFDGTDYLYRLDGADIEISGAESYIPASQQGLTVGGWFRLREPFAANTTLMSKWGASGAYGYRLYLDSNEEVAFEVSGDGTATLGVSSTIAPGEDEWFFAVGRFDPGDSISIWKNNFRARELTSVPASIYNNAIQFQISGNNGANNLVTGDASLCFLCASALGDGAILSLYEVTRALFGVVNVVTAGLMLLEAGTDYWLFENGGRIKWG